MTNKTEVRAEKVFFRNRIELAFLQQTPSGKTAIGLPITMQVIEDEDLIKEPTFSLSFEDAQFLIDELWRCGLRPSEGAGSAGSLKATEHHLQDMRAIAMGLLRKDGMP